MSQLKDEIATDNRLPIPDLISETHDSVTSLLGRIADLRNKLQPVLQTSKEPESDPVSVPAYPFAIESDIHKEIFYLQVRIKQVTEIVVELHHAVDF